MGLGVGVVGGDGRCYGFVWQDGDGGCGAAAEAAVAHHQHLRLPHPTRVLREAHVLPARSPEGGPTVALAFPSPPGGCDDPGRCSSQVVYLTNSGSEANDLAVMLARLHTGSFDVMTFRCD